MKKESPLQLVLATVSFLGLMAVLLMIGTIGGM